MTSDGFTQGYVTDCFLAGHSKLLNITIKYVNNAIVATSGYMY